MGQVVIKNFSVSQVETALDCYRKWFFKSILRVPDPPNESADRGIKIHKASENVGERLQAGRLLDEALAQHDENDKPWMPYVRALAATGIFPPPRELHAREYRFSLPTPFGIPFLGVIDMIRDEIFPIHVVDFKSTSDIRYAKTPGEAADNLQLNVYGHYIFSESADLDIVRAILAYVEAKKEPPKTKLPRAALVSVDLERDSVRAIWQGDRPFLKDGERYHLPVVLEQMITYSTCQDPNEIPPTTTTCPKYGGCPYRTNCGLSPFAGIGAATDHAPAKRISIEESKTMGFLSNKTNGTTKTATPAPVPETTPASAAPKSTGFLARARAAAPAAVPTGVIPPDAPSRTNEPAQAAVSAPEPADDAPEAAAPKKRGRPAKAAAPAAPAPTDSQDEAVSAAPAPAKAPRAAKTREFVLYVDCLPVKGAEQPATLEDFFGPIEMELDQWAQDEKKLPSYWLTSFSEQKAALGIAVRERIAKGLPPSMLVRSNSNLAREILPMLVPHATQVFNRI